MQRERVGLGRMKRLCKLGENFYWRLVIPKDLVIYFPFEREIRKSLKTTNFRSAKHLIGIYNAEADKLFTRIRSNALNDNEIEILVSEFTTDILALNEERRLEYGHQVTEYNNHYEANIPYAEIAETVQRQMIDATYTEIKRIFENYLEEKELDVRVDKGSIEYKKILKEASKGYLKTLEIDQKRDLLLDCQDLEEGESSFELTTHHHKESSSAEDNLTKKQYKKLSEVAVEYIEQQKGEANINDKTLGEKEQMLDRFTYIMGDKPVNQYSVSDFDEYKNKLSKLPDRIGNKKEYKGLTIDEVLDMKYEETLAIRTMRKHITTVKNFFQWALEREYSDVNKAIALKLPRIPRSEPESSRVRYNREDLKNMVKGYTLEYAESRDFEKRPDRFYIPLIALYTGMRQNEICQLGINDLSQDEASGVWYFNIYEEEGISQVKNKSAIRKVPVHPVLIELGLLEYHQKMKKKDNTRLWPQLKKGSDNKYSKSIQNWFNGTGDGREGFRQRYISKNPNKVFHSFRHSFKTEVAHLGINKDIRDEIAGHDSKSDMDKVYVDQYSVDVKLAELSKVTYGDLDLSSLKVIADSYL